ncbi:Carbamoyl-phosphate synthase [ammonia], mitochondrial [Holothuria leucospilota]|uniref:Carbamoyl-phosphate synthase [ammonia], mitochondrial n=1 Tax=Holothuria leucospilota TaxID=206669 RepID=A0A9Q1BAE1_HOLLE|nr:Carbamoyl-phosphate synthase [ammonia], mitochondrial [Holothuria leucospilota]
MMRRRDGEGFSHTFFLSTALKLFQIGCKLFATEKTAKYLQDHNIPASTVVWPLAFMEEEEREYPPATRRFAVDSGVPLLTNFEVVNLFAEALDEVGNLDASALFHFTKPSGSNFSKEA